MAVIKNIADNTRIHLEKFCEKHGYILDVCEMRGGKVFFKIKFKRLMGDKCASLMPGEYISVEKEEEIKNINISEIQKVILSIRKDLERTS